MQIHFHLMTRVRFLDEDETITSMINIHRVAEAIIYQEKTMLMLYLGEESDPIPEPEPVPDPEPEPEGSNSVDPEELSPESVDPEELSPESVNTNDEDEALGR